MLSNNSNDLSKLDDILQLLTQLYSFSRNYLQSQPLRESINLDSYFQSKKLNNKMLKQMEDSIIIASSSFPSWSSWLTHSYRFFYPFETRQLYFRTTSFGTSRSIVWLQERREEMIRTIRQGQHGRLRASNENSAAGASLQEIRFGRLKIDRATPIDRENVLRDAMNLFHSHARCKSKLEIQFLNEEGTGDGPTLEFYALVANELQKYQLGLWWNHENLQGHSIDYVRKLEGLFPAPYSQTDSKLEEICQYFSLMGIYFAKCLLDKYLIDMPLSISFLKLLCVEGKATNPSDQWYDGLLDLEDLVLIEPSRGKFFQQAMQLVDKRNQIINDPKITQEQKTRLCQSLTIDNGQNDPIDVEQLWLVLSWHGQHSESSKICGVFFCLV